MPLNDLDGDGMIDAASVLYYGGGGEGGVSLKNLLYADIQLTVVSDEGLEILQALSDGRVGTGYEDSADGTAEEQVVAKHGEVFARRVHFLAQPL